MLKAVNSRFLVNLRTSTMQPAFIASLRPAGYLVAPAYLTRATRDFAQTAGARRAVMVDNGLFDDVGQIAAKFQQEADGVLSALTDRSGRPIAPQDAAASHLSAHSRRRVAELARRVARDTAAASPGLPLAEQLALRPTGLIGVEDITGATMLRLGLDAALLANGRTQLRQRNVAVARRAIEATSAAHAPTAPVPRPLFQYYPVASAHDYDTAFDAGRAFAAAGLTSAAMGFGAYMADDTYTTTYKMAGRRRQLPRRLPQRYLRTILVARGFWDGWAEQTGGDAPAAFHFLGLGAPIMLGLVCLAAHGTKRITFDATSPIRDAVEGSLYTDNPAPLKSRTRRIAARLVDEPAYQWPCRCPFCTTYLQLHPFDRSAAAQWRANNPGRPIIAGDLNGSAPLAAALPLLSEPSGGAERKDVDTARVGHNHWVLQRICNDIGKHSTTRTSLAVRLDEVVRNYEATTNADSFASAVRAAYTLAATGRFATS